MAKFGLQVAEGEQWKEEVFSTIRTYKKSILYINLIYKILIITIK